MVLVVWGPLMIGGGYLVTAGVWSWDAVEVGMVYALGVTAVLFGKHIDKLEADSGKKIRTLPVLLGERTSRWVTLGMFVGQYAFVVFLILRGYFSPVLLIVVGALPLLRLSFKAYRQPRPKAPPPELPKGVWPLWFVAFAFIHTRRFGLLYVAGIVLDVTIRRMGLIG
jgi:1,4-dihydroxy-2-naphthoate octaprenyltransferase